MTDLAVSGGEGSREIYTKFSSVLGWKEVTCDGCHVNSLWQCGMGLINSVTGCQIKI